MDEFGSYSILFSIDSDFSSIDSAWKKKIFIKNIAYFYEVDFWINNKCDVIHYELNSTKYIQDIFIMFSARQNFFSFSDNCRLEF